MHLSWYGVPNAADPSCYDTQSHLENNCAADTSPYGYPIESAFSASKSYGDGGVVTDGRSIVIANASIEIPSNLSCSGPPGAQRPQITKTFSDAKQYYTLANSIVLKAGFMVVRDAHSRFSSCILRPTWYNAAQLALVTNTQTLIDDIEHQFYGTATKCGDVDSTGKPSTDGEACDMDDVLIVGFDTCDDTANSPRAVLSHLKFECNVGEAIHANGGGLDLHDANVHNFIEAVMNDSSGNDISRHEWPIGNVSQDTSNGEVKITFTPSPSAPFNGDNPILIGGFVPKTLSPPSGSTYIGNNGPPAINGLWNVEKLACLAVCTFDLKGSSWSGPNYTATWNAGSNVVAVPDTTSVRGGQFLCHAATDVAPICAPPPGFGPPSGDTFTLGQSLAHGALPNSLKITTAPSTDTISTWPQSGLLCMSAGCASGSEYVAYKLVDSSHIQITARGVDGTTQPAGDYASGSGVVPSAPMVIAPVPSANKVITTAAATAASTPGGEAAYFLNDHTGTFSAASDCNTAGTSACIILNANYRTWTYNADAGATPDALLTSSASGHSGSSLTGVAGNTAKLQPGMKVYNITTGLYLLDSSGNPVLIDSTSGTTVTLDSAPTAWPASTDALLFNGCGYPGFANTGTGTPQPWLGNCTATAYLLYGATANNGASGVTADSLHSHGWRVYFHTNNGQETVASKLIFDSGSGGVLNDIDTGDPTSIGLWTEGDADKIEFAQGKAEARTPFLNTGDPMNDNVTLANFNLRTYSDNSVVFANTATTALSDIHGTASSAGYADSAQKALSLTGNNLPGTSLYFDDPVVFRNTTNCANNVFASSPCGDVLGRAVLGGVAPALTGSLAGLGIVSGNDMTGRVALNNSGISGINTMTLSFAAAWPTAPVCFAQVESSTQNLGTANMVSTTSVTFQFAANLANNQTISYQCLGYR